MPATHKFYLDYMPKHYGYRATWDPDSSLEIGQIGKLGRDGSFSVYSSLEKLGIKPEVTTKESGSEMDYNTSENASIDIKLAGSAPIPESLLKLDDAGFNIRFGEKGGIIFKLGAYNTFQIVNLAEVQEAVLKLYHEEEWPVDYLIITKLIKAKEGTIMISTGSNASLDIKATAKIDAGQFKLSNASLGLSAVQESGSVFNYLGKENLTPLYQVMGLERPLITFWKQNLATKGNLDFNDAVSFEEQDYDPKETAD